MDGNETKFCNRCKTEKPVTEFRVASGQAGYRSHCKKCLSDHYAKYRKSPAGRRVEDRKNARYRALSIEERRRMWKRKWWKSQYNLSEEQHRALLQAQGEKCAICDKKKKRLYVDHCHVTGKVRGLLCPKCNITLGAMGDTYDSALKYIRYLERARNA